MKSKFIRFVAPLVVGVAALGGIVGCVMDGEQRQELLDRSNELQTQIEQDRERQMAEVIHQQQLAEAARQRGDAEAEARAIAAIDRANKAIALLDQVMTMVRQGHTVFEASVGPDGTVNMTPAAVAIGTSIGGPVGTAVTLGIPLLYSVISSFGWFKKAKQAQENLEAGESIVRNLDRGFMLDPAFNDLGTQLWPKIEAGMTKKAKQIVNEVSVT